MRRFAVLLASTTLLTAACGADPDPTGAGGAGGQGGSGGAVDETFPLACDPLVPSFCGFPFPSNVYTVADAASPTGLRVAFRAEGLPVGKDGHVQDPTPWSRADGFSAGSALLAEFPGATGTGLPGVTNLAASLEADSPTVIVDAETGEHIVHWSEIDAAQQLDTHPALLIHPAVPLTDGHRYLVAIRGLVDAAGKPIAPTAAFQALRDGTPSDHPSIEARRDLYSDIFAKLDSAGVAQSGLLLAWDFTTASRENTTGALLHMRDEALSLVGDDGPEYTITSVDQDLDPANILYRIHGTMKVPLYLDQVEPPAKLLLGDDGLPVPNPDMPTYDAKWELLIPNIAMTQPVGLLQHGHGLLGSDEQIESENFRTFCNQYGYAIFSTELIGMGSEDSEWIVTQLVNGQIDTLNGMFDRLHQGFLNNLLVMRMMSRRMTADPDYGVYLDGSKRFYWGISQGGIQGGVTMALSPDIDRGLLEVMGQPYNVLLNRSVDFGPFFTVAGFQFPDSRSQQHMLGLLQMNWDHVEPDGYTKYAMQDRFPDSPPDRRILMRAAVGDHQVTTAGGQIMARAMKAKHLDTGIRDVYGLEKVTAPSIDEDVAVYTEYEFGLPPEPTCNRPLSVCNDPHGELRGLDESREQANEFFTTGVAENTCMNQVCDFSALSGCSGDEDQDPCD